MSSNPHQDTAVEQMIKEKVHYICDGDPTPAVEVISKLLKEGFTQEKIESVIEYMKEDDEIKLLYNLIIPQDE